MTRVYAETSLWGIASKYVYARSTRPASTSPKMIALYEESLEGVVVKAKTS
ncbi:hypothetical protein QJS04_geneDACA000053 [Acorus gramineus]|uniref:Uncharacterized protein n=1 Tax=Acorus gramineus TaxID=55184 RepID=A0AAV9AR33_ACOGR|nr:hypothetical protein QJS04_geneDACA000053 [Acorus gramineus]